MAREWGVQAKYILGPQVKFNSGTGALAWAFDQMKTTLGRYPGAVAQTKGVNDAFYKGGLQYAKGIRRAIKAVGIKRRTGALQQGAKARRGKAAFRPSAMLFATGGKGSKHRWLLEHNIKRKDGSIRRKGTPYVEKGLKMGNSAAVNALENHIQRHADQIIRDANRIATRG